MYILMGMYYDVWLDCTLTAVGLEVWNSYTESTTWGELAQKLPEYSFLELVERCSGSSLVSIPRFTGTLVGNKLSLDTSETGSLKDRGGWIQGVYSTFFAFLIAGPAQLVIDHEIWGQRALEILPIAVHPDWDRKYGDPIGEPPVIRTRPIPIPTAYLHQHVKVKPCNLSGSHPKMSLYLGSQTGASSNDTPERPIVAKRPDKDGTGSEQEGK